MQARILKSSHLYQNGEDYYSFSIDWGEEKTREVIVRMKDSTGKVLSEDVKPEKIWEQKGSRGFNLTRHANGEWELTGLLDKTIPRVMPHAILLATEPARAQEAVQAMLQALQEEYLLIMSQPTPIEIIPGKEPFKVQP